MQNTVESLTEKLNARRQQARADFLDLADKLAGGGHSPAVEKVEAILNAAGRTPEGLQQAVARAGQIAKLEAEADRERATVERLQGEFSQLGEQRAKLEIENREAFQRFEAAASLLQQATLEQQAARQRLITLDLELAKLKE